MNEIEILVNLFYKEWMVTHRPTPYYKYDTVISDNIKFFENKLFQLLPERKFSLNIKTGEWILIY